MTRQHTGHHTVKSKTRVRVKMRDGSFFFARFKESTKRLMEFHDHESVPDCDVSGITIWKKKV